MNNPTAFATALQRYPEASAQQIGMATCLLAANAVHFDDGPSPRYVVESYEDLPAAYVAYHEGAKLPSCSCVDDPFVESNAACPHVLAVALYEAMHTPNTDAERQTNVVSEMAQNPVVVTFPEKITLDGTVMGEAPYSLNVTAEDPDGYQLQFTVRKQDSKPFFDAVTTLRQWLKAQHLAPVQRGNGYVRQAPSAQATETPAPSQSHQEPETKEPPRETSPRRDQAPEEKVYRFHAETLLRSEVNNKIIWAVMGSDIPAYCRRFGMRVWPEVLEEAGFDPVALEEVRSANLPNLHGFVAEYCVREDEKGQKPDKIIRLYKP